MKSRTEMANTIYAMSKEEREHHALRIVRWAFECVKNQPWYTGYRQDEIEAALAQFGKEPFYKNNLHRISMELEQWNRTKERNVSGVLDLLWIAPTDHRDWIEFIALSRFFRAMTEPCGIPEEEVHAVLTAFLIE